MGFAMARMSFESIQLFFGRSTGLCDESLLCDGRRFMDYGGHRVSFFFNTI